VSDTLHARTRAAAGVRDLISALLAHDAPDHLLDEVASVARDLGERLADGPARSRPESGMRDDFANSIPADGERVEHFADCPISGADNPLSSQLVAYRDGDGVRCDTQLGPAYEGAPGRAHGGAVAALFDDAFGFAAHVAGVPCYAGELTVRFVRPTPTEEPLVLRARATEQVGRKLYLEGTLEHRGVVVATARSLNIHVTPERLGRAEYDY
jgi:acyl-coenzyme A thioesterase PaaI-like protein